MARYSIDLLKEGVASKGTRALILFIRLKDLYVSGYIKDFEKQIDFRKFGYATITPFKKDIKKLLDKGFFITHKRNTATKPVIDVQLKGTKTIQLELINRNFNSCEIRLDSTSKMLREQIHAAILQDAFCKQEYKAGKSSKKDTKSVLVIDTSIPMDSPRLHTLDQNTLTRVSFKVMAKKLGYRSQATAYKAMTKMINLGLFKKFNQVIKVLEGGHKFKGLRDVRVLTNIYEVTDSLLPKMSRFSKMINV